MTTSSNSRNYGLGLKAPSNMLDFGLDWMNPEQRSLYDFPTRTGTSNSPGTTSLWGTMKDLPIGSIMDGIGTLGNLWGANRALGLARDQFAFQKDFANTNLANQIKSYNTALEDRARSRAVAEGRSQESAQEYIDRNRMSR